MHFECELTIGSETREWHCGQRHMKGRTYRSDTWPHQPATAVLKEPLANGEPSIHGPKMPRRFAPKSVIPTVRFVHEKRTYSAPWLEANLRSLLLWAPLKALSILT